MEDGTEKNSYAYHLVFQSDKKTLTDIEVNEIMDRLYNELNAKSGWQVR
jgi:phenylalanyl-tRNA synthetase beta subunit